MSNEQAFLRFKELLETRQLAHEPERDIRKHVLSQVTRKVGVGYVAKGLESSFGANLKNLFVNPVSVDSSDFEHCDTYIALGTIYADQKKSHQGAARLFNTASTEKEVLLFEAGFLATTHSWAHSFKEHNPMYACLGYVYDDIAHYFMADYPNRIIQKLNSDEALSPTEQERAATLLKRIVENRVSKYNAQPMYAPTMTEGYSRRVLVCDQAYADASTVYGKVGDAEFEKMLLAAISENPDAEILVKTHPDTFWTKGGRTGYYAHLQSTGRVRILRDPINPYSLFELVDTVYVGTSQMGLEALFAGKKVVTFGAPFYGGWGLTDDRQAIPHRHRERSLAEIFHYFYIWYTIYQLPNSQGPAKLEDVLSYIEVNRPYALPPTEEEVAAPPRVSIILPVHGVEKYVEECIESLQRQTLREIEIIPVNDASPDGSQGIIDRLASLDQRIKPIILSENIGQGFARNRGLEIARGEYIWLIDADDIMPDPDFLMHAVEKADAEQLSMLRGRKAVFRDDGKTAFSIEKTFLDSQEVFFPNSAGNDELRGDGRALFSWHCWLWLYRREFLKENDIRFELTQMEERPFIVKALSAAEKIGSIDSTAVVYRKRSESTMHRAKTLEDVERFLTNFEQCADILLSKESPDLEDDKRASLNLIVTQFLHAFFVGWPYRTIMASSLSEQERNDLFVRFSKKFMEADFHPRDIRWDWNALDTKLRLNGAYELLVAAICTQRFEWLDAVVGQKAISQATLYEELLDPTTETAQQEFQAALNRYARNTMVQMDTGDYRKDAHPKPRIVIHIGSTKTGSTFLQNLLDKNRPALLREGVWVPEVGLYWQPTRPRKQAGHSEFPKYAVRNDAALREHIERGLDLMDGKIHTIVLSSEAFFLGENAHRLAKYFEGYPIEMIVYLRRQDEWANSQYCEFVAGGAVGRVDIPIEDWLKLPVTRRRLDYRVPLKIWSDELGSDKVHARVFDKAAFKGGDLLNDFAHATGLPQLLDLPRPDQTDQNDARLVGGHVELIRQFNNRSFASRDDYFSFIEDVGDALSSWRDARGLPQPKPWALSAEQADALMAEYSEVNAEIGATYLNLVDTPIFGPRGQIPEQAAVFSEEMLLVDQIYKRHAPAPAKPSPKKPGAQAQKKPAQKNASQKPPATKPSSKAPSSPPVPQVLNYGLFGWRLWLLTPILASFYARKVSPARFREFLSEPAAYSKRHWEGSHAAIALLLYPQGNPMGPLGVFKIWVPVVRALIARTGRADMRKAFEQDPIAYLRSLRSPLRRVVGRLMFPIGELR